MKKKILKARGHRGLNLGPLAPQLKASPIIPIFLSQVGFNLVYRLKFAMSSLLTIRSMCIREIADFVLLKSIQKPWYAT